MGDRARVEQFCADTLGKNPLFVCTISGTRTSRIPGITVAGANPELLKATPAADAELLFYGKCLSIEGIPATPDGKPTPALITRTALTLADIQFLIVDSGAEVKPKAPYISMGVPGPSEDITTGKAIDEAVVKTIFEYGKILGQKFSYLSDYVVLGESIPGGTTTALGVLMGVGIDARGRMSSSIPDNPHGLRNRAVELGMKTAGIGLGDLKRNPLRAVSVLGDSMIPAVAGMAIGAGRRNWVVLAGGTQMMAVLAIISGTEPDALEKVIVATTTYVANDQTSDIGWIIKRIGRVPIVAADLGLSESGKPGLRAYSTGFVREGVGAGGAALAAMLKSRGAISTDVLWKEIEQNYLKIIESPLQFVRSGSG